MPQLPATQHSILRLTRPPPQALRDLVSANADAAFTYPDVGATAQTMPTGWNPHRVGGPVGAGQADFTAAVEAIRAWVPFDLGWVHVLDPKAPVREGAVVGFASQQIAVWVINVCRVVYVVDEQHGEVHRFGFAYGTLPDHAVRGEELFIASWDRRTDEVRFDIHKFSQPNRYWARLAGPISRAIQARFSHDSLERVRRAVTEARGEGKA